MSLLCVWSSPWQSACLKVYCRPTVYSPFTLAFCHQVHNFPLALSRTSVTSTVFCGSNKLVTESLSNTKSFVHTNSCFAQYLKLQSVSFASLSPSLFENLELQFLYCVGCESARLQHGWILCFQVNVWLSVIAPVWILYFVITDSILRLGIYDPNKNCHRILQIWTSNTSATLVLTNSGKMTINRGTNGDLI